MRMGKLGIFLRLVYAEWASLVTGAFSAILIVLGLGVSIASAIGIQIPSESIIQIATWTLAAVCGGRAAYSVWAREYDQRIELEHRRTAEPAGNFRAIQAQSEIADAIRMQALELARHTAVLEQSSASGPSIKLHEGPAYEAGLKDANGSALPEDWVFLVHLTGGAKLSVNANRP